MSNLPTLSEDQIEKLTGSRGLRRGWDYFRDEAVLHPSREDRTLTASCRGTGRKPYHVELVFGDETLARAECTCPVGKDGRCKHIAAVLLQWNQRPESFVSLDHWNETLAGCSRATLASTLKTLLRRRPDIERLVQSLLAVEDDVEEPSVVEQATAALATAGDDIDQLAGALRPLLDHAEQTAERGDLPTAAEATAAILEALVAAGPGQRAAAELAARAADNLLQWVGLLKTEGPLRARVLGALVDLRATALAEGLPEYRPDFAEAILAAAHRRERLALAERLESLVPQIESPAGRDAVAAMLLELAAPAISDREWVALARRVGRSYDAVRRLALARRWDEAEAVAAEASDAQLAQIGSLLVGRGRAEMAVRLIEARQRQAASPLLADWIEAHRRRLATCRRAANALQTLLGLEPSLARFRPLRTYARRCGLWSEYREAALEQLRATGRLADLGRALLLEGELPAALELARQELAAHEPEAAARIARTAEKAFPAEALVLYRLVAERLAERGEPDDARRAVRLVARLGRIASKLDRKDEWVAVRQRLRRRAANRPELLKELDAAGL